MTFDLGYKHYGRYVDDFFLVVTEEELPQALRDVKVIEEFLQGLGLVLHPKKRYIQETDKGVAFLGAVIYPNRIVAGRRMIKFFKEAAMFHQQRPNYVDSVVSYMGHMTHFDSARTIAKIYDGMGWDYKY